MKATEQYFPVVLFFMLYKVVLAFESVDEVLKSDHSNESYREALCYEAVFFFFSPPCKMKFGTLGPRFEFRRLWY